MQKSTIFFRVQVGLVFTMLTKRLFFMLNSRQYLRVINRGLDSIYF